MAAHIKTYFDEVQSLPEFGWDELKIYQDPIDNAGLGNNLEHEDWRMLHYAETPAEFMKWVNVLAEKYFRIWRNLGCPKNYEDWKERENEATLCPKCNELAVSAEKFALRIWACGHFEVIEKEAK